MFNERIERAENELASNAEYRRLRDNFALPMAIADLLVLAEVKGLDPSVVLAEAESTRDDEHASSIEADPMAAQRRGL